MRNIYMLCISIAYVTNNGYILKCVNIFYIYPFILNLLMH